MSANIVLRQTIQSKEGYHENFYVFHVMRYIAIIARKNCR